MTNFTSYTGGLESPATGAETVTPHASTNFTGGVSRALWVGGAGNVAVVFNDDSVAVFVGLAAGSLLPVQAKRVNAVNTTATNMLALF